MVILHSGGFTWSFQEKPKSFPAKPKFWSNTIKHKITSGNILEISLKITCWSAMILHQRAGSSFVSPHDEA